MLNPGSALVCAAFTLNALALALHIDNAQFQPYEPHVLVRADPGPAEVELVTADVAPVGVPPADGVRSELARPRAKSVPPVVRTPAFTPAELPPATVTADVREQAVPLSTAAIKPAPACGSRSQKHESREAPMWAWGPQVVVCNTMLH